MKIEKADIESFKKYGNKVLIIKKTKENPVYNYFKYKSNLILIFNYLITIICKFLPPSEFKNSLYRLMGITIGKNVSISNECVLCPMYPELLKIEDNVIIGWGAKIFAHEFLQDKIRIGSVHLKKNSLLGQYSLVRPGVVIGENSKIAAMSFVNKDIEDNILAGGVPAKLIKKKLI